MFIDKAHIYVTAGSGGSGCISFRREKYVPLGGPDGGNGGKGGDVLLVADPHLNTLLDLTYKPHYKAESGQAGGSKKKYGKGAKDTVVKVPVGTIVYKAGGELLADLKEPGMILLVARGGRGGRGNAVFKTSRNTAPRIFEKGEPGEEITLDLELKLIADVGLVGFPNAGKSTFLSRISSARPKIADYPFTTLTPNLGVASFGGKSFVIADIPGLIEGAHEGKGLGDGFLRHIQRTRVIVHLVDLFGFCGKTAYSNYKTINRELAGYSVQLAKKPMLIAANKTDITDSDIRLREFKRNLKGKKVFPVSAVTGAGIKELLARIVVTLEKVPSEEPLSEPVKRYVYEPDFTVEKRNGEFIVSGTKIEKLAAMTDFKHEETLRRFQNIIQKMGVDDALEEKGIRPGDIVRIGKNELTYEK